MERALGSKFGIYAATTLVGGAMRSPDTKYSVTLDKGCADGSGIEVVIACGRACPFT